MFKIFILTFRPIFNQRIIIILKINFISSFPNFSLNTCKNNYLNSINIHNGLKPINFRPYPFF